jgi:hypothetical protein
MSAQCWLASLLLQAVECCAPSNGYTAGLQVSLCLSSRPGAVLATTGLGGCCPLVLVVLWHSTRTASDNTWHGAEALTSWQDCDCLLSILHLVSVCPAGQLVPQLLARVGRLPAELDSNTTLNAEGATYSWLYQQIFNLLGWAPSALTISSKPLRNVRGVCNAFKVFRGWHRRLGMSG